MVIHSSYLLRSGNTDQSLSMLYGRSMLECSSDMGERLLCQWSDTDCCQRFRT
ncbi:Uncharacterised protein [Mycobacteroides abscessus subsp. abscessus]|nr:Uncharacterised protein [Mycobacteroides abscessus subsp. abscessus]